jgi:hypothetical protein
MVIGAVCLGTTQTVMHIRNSAQSTAQCMKPPPPAPPSLTRSKGNNRLQPAVSTNIAADVNTGKDGDIDSKKPAETGAMTPVLHNQLLLLSRAKVGTAHSRLRAADVPHAVPLIAVPNVSGVIPSVFVSEGRENRSNLAL